ncbi:MAG: pilus assembly protein TadG-related protein [Aliihoeflea sp.]|uniref:pilus assembly protein TadG-related protein n=1 Tax=Aliihoeflea sp. TaxID=2608088 RepID=UPI004034F2AC
MARFSNILTRFMSDRRGNFAILTGAALSMLAVGAGFGVNTAQLMNTKSALQNALDAAVASTARDLTTGVIAEADARASVEAFLIANGGGAFARDGAVTLETLTVDRTARTVAATAKANIDLAFPLFGAEKTRDVAATTAALYADRRIEVAMMLDVTGSMAGSKIRDLKTAAKNAVDSFLRNQRPGQERVRISIVPYANSVNAGTLAASSVYVERNAGERVQAPSNIAPRAVSASRPDNCATERKGDFRYLDDGPDVSMVNRDFLIDDFIRRYDGNDARRTCPSVAVVPLTNDARALHAAIDGFNAVGGTGGHIGVQWTWYMLSERWANVLPAKSRPMKPSDDVQKYAILMTDGEFNLSYFDARQTSEIYNGRGKATTRNEAKILCREMRAQGIEIFTIGFQLQDQNARETMSACASPDTGRIRHFYDTANGVELDAAFQDIASNIETLTLTK